MTVFADQAASLVDQNDRLEAVVAMMRELSQQTDPQGMVRTYATRVRQMLPVDVSVSLSRRDLEAPRYRITRSTRWKEETNPWKNPERLPLLSGGLLGDLIYGDQPVIIDDLNVSPDDPGYEHFEGMRSLMALPNYDQGVALNMTVLMQKEPGAFDPESLPERVWMSNLFGRATHTLVLKEELGNALASLQREMKIVADIQKSLLPQTIPTIPGLSLATHYQTFGWAGGDYYDFFELPGEKWGILIADVSGHGTPAAVLMAITHALAHGHPGHPEPPAKLLEHVNDRLAARYTSEGQMFVTAFYAIFDPATRQFTYASAGHNPPRVKRCADGSIFSLDAVGGLPLGLIPGDTYEQGTLELEPGDQVILYTDGITEATNAAGQMFGMDRLDRSISMCRQTARGLIKAILRDLEEFSQGTPPSDDQTLVVAKVL